MIGTANTDHVRPEATTTATEQRKLGPLAFQPVPRPNRSTVSPFEFEPPVVSRTSQPVPSSHVPNVLHFGTTPVVGGSDDVRGTA